MSSITASRHFIITMRDEQLIMLPERALFWPRHNALLLSDLHLGKTGHFRKAGIPLPSSVHHADLNRLSKLILEYSAKKVFLLGDLFHSLHNSEWNHLLEWRANYPQTEVHLIRGNHDIVNRGLFEEANIVLHHDQLEVPPFLFVHDHCNIKSSLYIICGHIHPAIHLTGRGRQSAKFPCFWFGKKSGVLPAFGNFTGSALISPEADDAVFFIAGESVTAYQGSRKEDLSP